MARILLVDDEPPILKIMTTLLSVEGYEVVSAEGGEPAKELLEAQEFDLMITDLRMAPISGMELLEWAREARPNMAVIMMTGHASVRTTAEALRLGAFDYAPKPLNIEDLLLAVRKALQSRESSDEATAAPVTVNVSYGLGKVVAVSPAMQLACETARKVAATETVVFLWGEHGAGKRFLAHAIHGLSTHNAGEFLAVDCGELAPQDLDAALFTPEPDGSGNIGVLVAAGQGTVVVTRLDQMSGPTQERFLKVLTDKAVSDPDGANRVPLACRLIVTSERSVEQLIPDENFADALCRRLSAAPIEIKPLRERREDIVPLAYDLLREQKADGAPDIMIDTSALHILEAYSWPRNVEELKETIKSAASKATDNTIGAAALPERVSTGGSGQPPQAGGADTADHRARLAKRFLKSKTEL